MNGAPKTGMVLAAGLGLRMRPITDTIPKPMVEVAGCTMLDRAIHHLRCAGVERIVVNLHWKGEVIRDHLAGHADVVLSDESDTLLETGGGVARALPLLGDAPFYVANGDIVWFDGLTPALARLAAAWDDDKMDALLLMQRTPSAYGYEGPGDFFLDPLGLARRRKSREVAPYLFAGVQILHPRLVADVPKGPFSLNLLYDRALAEGRLWGVVHDGAWYHVGTPDSLAEIDKRILDAQSGFSVVSHQ
jgi:MurNAc alpha-1-phosphate uridylyltransferase